MKHRVVVVEGPLALRMQRLAAARARDVGLEIRTIPQLASRLAGGFCRPVHEEILYPAISDALSEGGFVELSSVSNLPGMVRAVANSLRRVWRADFDLETVANQSPRFADLSLIQRRVRAVLPAGALIPPDLRDAALTRLPNAKALFGAITIHSVNDIDKVWRPMLLSMANHLPLSWQAVGPADRSWFTGHLEIQSERTLNSITSELCADPRAEVVEALRWVRALLSSGDTQASEIAVTTASPAEWDDHMLVLASDAALPIHFSHGVPALSSRDGQACAALADVLTSGLSQDRVRRLINRLPSEGATMLPNDWSKGLPRRAGLFTLNHWTRALALTRDQRASGEAAELTLLPMLSVLAKGVEAAEAAGKFLRGAARAIWQSALEAAPPAAINISLESLRVEDGKDPGNCVVWGPASHLFGSPRQFLRLIGLSGRTWPRPESEDPLLPDHLVPRRRLESMSATERDRLHFTCMLNYCGGKIVLSRSRRSAEGSLLSKSSLWPRDLKELVRNRARIPEHAFSESDRLLARPEEAGKSPLVRSTRACWRSRQQPALSAHDGIVRAGHPVIERALQRVHSTTSLKQLLRDPLGFVWRYGLGWRSVELAQQPLAFDPIVFGELVHELLRCAVDALEPHPGFARASRDEIAQAVTSAADHIFDAWPLQRAVPPQLLWRDTLDEATRRCSLALTQDEAFQPGTKSWTEVGFGSIDLHPRDAPWNALEQVIVPGTDLRLSGRIDRIDVKAGGEAARISEYKTGAAPQNGEHMVLAKGSEVQRALYAVAARQLLPGLRTIISRIVYLDGISGPLKLRGDALDSAIGEISKYLNLACAHLRGGDAYPGPDAQDKYNYLRLALPADIDDYFRVKRSVFDVGNRDLLPLWNRP
jgi:hypothetical protein